MYKKADRQLKDGAIIGLTKKSPEIIDFVFPVNLLNLFLHHITSWTRQRKDIFLSFDHILVKRVLR